MTFQLWAGEPERIALREGNAAWTRGQMAEAAAAHATQLHDDFGAEPGLICAVLVTANAAGIAALSAAFTAHGVVAPLSPAATPAELAAALARLRPQVVLAEPATQPLAQAALDRLASGEGGMPEGGTSLPRTTSPEAGTPPASITPPKVARPLRDVPSIHAAPNIQAAPNIEATPHVVICRGPDHALQLVQQVPSPGRLSPRLRLSEDRALVIWTSGTTGEPRAIALRGEGVRQAALAQVAHLGITPGDALPVVLPLNAVGGLMVIVRAALAHAVIEALPRFEAAHLIELANVGRADHVSLVPVMLQRLLAQMVEPPVERLPDPPPEPLRQGEPGSVARGTSSTHGFGMLLIGGAACPVGLVRDAGSSGLRVALTWGMTESCAQAATALPDEVAGDPTCVGRALPHVRVRTEPDGRLALQLVALDPSEVRLSEPNRDDSPILTSLCDEDGWFVTGDLGSVAADGRIRVTGRASDRIISGGVNVDPGEVEQTLARHPAVAEAAVVGVPDDEWGERVCALLVAAVRHVPDGAPGADSGPGPERGLGKADGAGAGGGADANGWADADGGPAREPLIAVLDAYCREQLTAAKRPRHWRVVDALPRTAAGKIDRAACASHFAIQSPHASD